MKYRQKRYNCGDYLEVEIFALLQNTKQLKRRKREKETSPKRKVLNDNKSIEHAVRVANLNFGVGDYALDLTFNNENLPATPEEVAREAEKYIRRIKYAMGEKAKELTYMYFLSNRGKDGRRVRVHIHMLISGADREILINKWGKGRANVTELQPDENGIEGKVRYYAKQSGMGFKRWVGSKNLKKPEVITSDNAVTPTQVEHMYLNPDDRNFFEKKYKTWLFTECTAHINEYDGSYYIKIKMRKEKKSNEKSKKKRPKNKGKT